MKLKNQINDSNRTIAFEFYSNSHNRAPSQLVSFVRGKVIDYSSDTINELLDLQAPEKFGIQMRRGPHNVPYDVEWEQIFDELCCPGAQ